MNTPSSSPVEDFRTTHTINFNNISLTATHYSRDGDEFLSWTSVDGRSTVTLKKSDNPSKFVHALAQVKNQTMPTV